ncbi:hypothetical protein QJS10_CPA01g02007 [Acorus calamus]|uniref:Uncharacterized protein n=1 Tax=Acorus calamus TaxID=4465 RepID=A0AAV9FNK3_ACOCL|nr:hypothetical protein QJS10_CPA01g02007 [Acorus calamus]
MIMEELTQGTILIKEGPVGSPNQTLEEGLLWLIYIIYGYYTWNKFYSPDVGAIMFSLSLTPHRARKMFDTIVIIFYELVLFWEPCFMFGSLEAVV